jgi:hypothetical protein
MWFLFAFPLWPEMLSIFFMCFLTIWTSSFEKALFSSFAHWFFGGDDFWGPCIFWLLIPCQMYSWQGFSPIVGCIFSLVTISFVVMKFLVSCGPIYHSFLLVIEPFVFYLGTHCLCLCKHSFSIFPDLFCTSFKVSGCILRSLIHFDLVFV